MIRQALASDTNTVIGLAQLLWPGHEKEELYKEMLAYITSKNSVILISYEGNELIGFAQCSLRYDYVEGTESSPVGYLEGIYIKSDYRRRGKARKLIESCEAWAKKKGCSEFASDCEIGNLDSLKFHLSTGFEEANRVICFKKRI